MTPRVPWSERPALLVPRPRADEALPAGAGQGADSVIEAALCERLRLPAAGPEAGTPKQALSLCGTEIASENGNFGCGLGHGRPESLRPIPAASYPSNEGYPFQAIRRRVPIVTDLVLVDEMEIRGRQAKVKLWSLPVGVKGTAHAN